MRESVRPKTKLYVICDMCVISKRGESSTEGSDEPNHTRSGRDERSVEKYEEGVRRYDEDHAGDGGRPGHREKVV